MPTAVRENEPALFPGRLAEIEPVLGSEQLALSHS